MIKNTIWIVGSLFLASSAQAKPVIAKSFDFRAPTVYDVTSVPNPNPGIIVFDALDQVFKGKAWSSGWHILSPTSAVGSIQTKNANYSLVASDDVVIGDANGGTFTLTLPAASSNSGKVYQLKRVDTTAWVATNHVAIGTSGSDEIDGESSTSLNTQFESLTVVSDGSTWHILKRDYPQGWDSSETWAGSWTAGGTDYSGKWRRVGDSLEALVKIDYDTSGSGNLTIDLPFGTIDTNKVFASAYYLKLGDGVLRDVNGSQYVVTVKYSDTDTVILNYTSVSGSNTEPGNNITNTVPFTFANGDSVVVNFKVPMTGWH
ncbi:MAG: hypothetical protein COT74_11080 [Bdellovibrionales bacterium CG10_big_fil_rev_8_21_14_0_10_45_34]|nr:MAG: hypothetical protein COT74_11080 [Bdellovibrionales bacterium CG10_big_fil_rev_8_21_14_0_10_45_34]